MSVIYTAKTKWAGLIWVHAKYLNEAFSKKEDLILMYKDKVLKMKFDEIRSNIKKSKQVEDKFKSGVWHNQYGFEIK